MQKRRLETKQTPQTQNKHPRIEVPENCACAEIKCGLTITVPKTPEETTTLTEKLIDAIKTGDIKMVDHLAEQHNLNFAELSINPLCVAINSNQSKTIDHLVRQHDANIDSIPPSIYKTNDARSILASTILIKQAKSFFFALTTKTRQICDVNNMLNKMSPAQKAMIIHWPIPQQRPVVSGVAITINFKLNQKGKTALQCGYDRKDTDLMTLLLAHGATPEQDLNFNQETASDIFEDFQKNCKLALALARNGNFCTINDINVYNNQVLIDHIVNNATRLQKDNDSIFGSGPYCADDLQLLIEGLHLKEELSVNEENKIVPKTKLESPQKETEAKNRARKMTIKLLSHPIQESPQDNLKLLERLAEIDSGLGQGMNNVFNTRTNLPFRGLPLIMATIIKLCQKLQKENQEMSHQLVTQNGTNQPLVFHQITSKPISPDKDATSLPIKKRSINSQMTRAHP